MAMVMFVIMMVVMVVVLLLLDISRIARLGLDKLSTRRTTNMTHVIVRVVVVQFWSTFIKFGYTYI